MVWCGVSILKKFIMIFMIVFTLYGDALSKIKAQIILNIAHLITDKSVVKIYVDDPDFMDIFKDSDKIKRVTNCFQADLIITKDSKSMLKLCNKHQHHVNIISTTYKDYKQNKDVSFGAFFWQKGRANMLLNSKIIQKEDINIPQSYQKYLD